ncbi:Tab2/Atab2 family RNA-binding protein [Oscillatoria sp. FACHB-1406]|uniref:Tab2/Atab2 family RNA-binding protein n=1 Tax=Oscillatoria sp. FACHB-1406 TaxID=2692846 RepID=UPI0016880B0D|nr:Tab2/Atab2 family RNA-binding protein [Oscillatoria sp. FACHB-1406]MBD2577683.1 Tab2/Atab2 family RNA-binding protein [Oscillatoria sp. FACHB-1406]
MNIWQADFYKRSQSEASGEILWELLACDRAGNLCCIASCPQKQANSDWLASQLKNAAGDILPDEIQVFRPQSLSLLTAAGEKLGIPVTATRRTEALKRILQERWGQNAIALDRLPPQALPDTLWGEQWRFASLPAGEIVEVFRDRPIPILELPESLHPLSLGIAAPTPIPGIIIDGGRRSMQLARWLQEVNPAAVNYIPTTIGESGGLILEAGLVERWVLITFEDEEVARSAEAYNQRKQGSKGLHFLLVRPDDSGVTYSGLWLLRSED